MNRPPTDPGRCPVHGSSAVATCTRCGTYVCESCATRGGGETRCPACPVEQKTSVLAIVAVCLAAIPCALIFVVGGILGLVAYIRIGERPNELAGRGVALVAMILSAFWLVIAMVGILAAVAIPNFIGFQARSKQSVARLTLVELHAAQQAHRADTGTFATGFEELRYPFDPDAKYTYAKYTYFLGDTEAGSGAELIPAGVESWALPDHYRLIAVRNIDSDPVLDVWSIEEGGHLENVVDDVDEF